MVVVVILLGAIAGGGLLYWKNNRSNGPVYRTASVTRGNILAAISATGTVEPEEVVDVGAQVAGLITGFGKDKDGNTVDYGSRVEAGTVLAMIDDSTYAADVQSATAALSTARASVTRAEADLKQYEARLYQAERDWERAQKLGVSEALAQSTYDSYRSAYEIAAANVAVGRAAVIQARCSVEQAEAALAKARRNLAFCVIKSPVDGVVIDRRVNIGQTVVSSLNAPSLFLIAKDLTRVRLWVPVNEADIGNIHPGQPVTFTVDALPGETFRGEVVKIRLNASMTQNVVTYVVEVAADNSGGKLLPYLSANARFEVARRENVLVVPNAALRWRPRAEQVASRKGDNGPDAMASVPTEASAATLWVPDGKYVRGVRVVAGLTDGASTEVQGEGIHEGLAVVTGEEVSQAADDGQTRSPFTPQFRRSRSAAAGSTGGTSGGSSAGRQTGAPRPPM
jgi:HlyD family secretion protein